jgi:hypothetical protein
MTMTLVERDWQGNLISVRALKRNIQAEVGRDLDRAVFALDDAGLLPMACTECSFRTTQGEGEQVCFRAACFDAKVQAHIERAVKERGLVAISTHYRAADVPAGVLQQAEYAWVEEERDEEEIDDGHGEPEAVELTQQAAADCGRSVEAIVAHGSNVGKTMRVCTDAKCPVHGKELRDEGRRAKDLDWHLEEYKRKQAAEAEKRKVRVETRRRALRAIVAGWTEACPPLLGAVLLEERLAGYYGVDPLKELDRIVPYLPKAEGTKAAKPDQHQMLKALRAKAAQDAAIVPRVLLYFALYKEVENNWGGDRRDLLAAAASLRGVDLKAIEKAVKAGEKEPGPKVWPEPDASGYFTHGAEIIKCGMPGGHKADVVLVQVKDGWYRGHEVRAGKVTSTRRPSAQGEKYAERMEALAAAAEEIVEWARGQAQNGATNAARNQARLIVLWASKLRKDTGVPEAAPLVVPAKKAAPKKPAQTSAKVKKPAPSKKVAKKKGGRK